MAAHRRHWQSSSGCHLYFSVVTNQFDCFVSLCKNCWLPSITWSQSWLWGTSPRLCFIWCTIYFHCRMISCTSLAGSKVYYWLMVYVHPKARIPSSPPSNSPSTSCHTQTTAILQTRWRKWYAWDEEYTPPTSLHLSSLLPCFLLPDLLPPSNTQYLAESLTAQP